MNKIERLMHTTKMTKMSEFVISRKHCGGKKRKYWLATISPFPTMFSKGCFPRVFFTKDRFLKSYIAFISISEISL